MTTLLDHVNDLKSEVQKVAPKAKVSINIEGLPLAIITQEADAAAITNHSKKIDDKRTGTILRCVTHEGLVTMESEPFNIVETAKNK